MGMRAAWGRQPDTLMAARRGYGGNNSIGGGQGVPFTDSVGASWRGRSVGRMGVSGLVAAVMPEMEGLAIVPGRHCTGLPRANAGEDAK